MRCSSLPITDAVNFHLYSSETRNLESKELCLAKGRTRSFDPIHNLFLLRCRTRPSSPFRAHLVVRPANVTSTIIYADHYASETAVMTVAKNSRKSLEMATEAAIPRWKQQKVSEDETQLAVASTYSRIYVSSCPLA